MRNFKVKLSQQREMRNLRSGTWVIALPVVDEFGSRPSNTEG